MKQRVIPSKEMRFLCFAVVVILLGGGAVSVADRTAAQRNVPPEGFTALFNGKDFTGWRVNTRIKEMWRIEDGILKSHGLLKQWGADLTTEKALKVQSQGEAADLTLKIFEMRSIWK